MWGGGRGKEEKGSRKTLGKVKGDNRGGRNGLEFCICGLPNALGLIPKFKVSW